MATPLSDPAFYSVDPNGNPMDTTVEMPGQPELQKAFYVFAHIELLQHYAHQSGRSPDEYRIRSFETLEDVQNFVEQNRDNYEHVIVNPKLGQSSAVEPFDRLLEMARELAVQE